MTASISDTEDITLYISALEERITENNSDPEYVKDYRRAQLYQVQGLFAESLICLERAMTDARPFKYDFIWERTFLSIGTLFASNLDYFDKLDEAEDVYIELLRSHPDGDFLCDYAIFLHKRRRDFNKAEIVFQRALNLFPGYSSLHLKYAGFLRHAKRDIAGADKQYELAVQSNPENADALGSYASFLHGVLGNMDGASRYYEVAVKIDPTHANNMCNYGLFLSEVKLRYDLAETQYSNTLKYAPLHVNTLYNYGVMLDTHCKRKSEAESLYRRAIEGEPNHSFALYNLAVLLEEKLSQLSPNQMAGKAVRFSSAAANAISIATPAIATVSLPLSLSLSTASSMDEEDGDEVKGRGDTVPTVVPPQDDVELKKQINALAREVRIIYERAVAANPTDAATTADFGRFLLTKMDDPDTAEELLKRAVQLDDKSEVALFNLGKLFHRSKVDLVSAESVLQQLLIINPKHSNGWRLLAKVFIEISKMNRLECSVPSTPSKGSFGSTICKFQPLSTMSKSQSVNLSTKSLLGHTSSKTQQFNVSHKSQSGKQYVEKAMDCYEKAIELANDPGSIMVEYLHIIGIMGDTKEKVRALATAGVTMKLKGRKMSKERNIKAVLDSFVKNNSL